MSDFNKGAADPEAVKKLLEAFTGLLRAQQPQASEIFTATSILLAESINASSTDISTQATLLGNVLAVTDHSLTELQMENQKLAVMLRPIEKQATDIGGKISPMLAEAHPEACVMALTAALAAAIYRDFRTNGKAIETTMSKVDEIMRATLIDGDNRAQLDAFVSIPTLREKRKAAAKK